jgi:hypothetical protein
MDLKSRPVAIVVLIALLLVFGLQPTSTLGQTLVTIDVDLIDDLVKVNASKDDNTTLILDGLVTVTMPDLPFLEINVTLSVRGPTNFTATVAPTGMTFTQSGNNNFTLTVIVPAGLENVTGADFIVRGVATSMQYPTASDEDQVSLVFEYPVVNGNGNGNGGVDPSDIPDPGPNPLIYCGVSIAVGILVTYLVYWKRSKGKGRRRRRDYEVVYLPRKKPGDRGVEDAEE